jgi:hypothetical protein
MITNYELAYWNQREQYLELVFTLGFSHSQVRPFAANESHDAFVARARACKAAYDVMMKEVA